MNQTNYITFEGEEIPYTSMEGTNYFPLKPLCELLGVDYESQRQSIRRSPILKHFVVQVQVLQKGAKTGPKTGMHLHNVGADTPETAVLAPEKEYAPTLVRRQVVSLPEQVVYGWMMQLPISDAKGMAYLWKFYQAMWQFFENQAKGPVRQLVEERMNLERKAKHLRVQLADDPIYMEFKQVDERIKRLKSAENKMMSKQVHQVELLFADAEQPLLNP